MIIRKLQVSVSRESSCTLASNAITMSVQPITTDSETAQEDEVISSSGSESEGEGFIYNQLEDNEKEPLELYRPGYLHPVVVGDIIRPDSSRCPNRPANSPTGYRILHKLGHGGEATVWLAQGLETPE